MTLPMTGNESKFFTTELEVTRNIRKTPNVTLIQKEDVSYTLALQQAV